MYHYNPKTCCIASYVASVSVSSFIQLWLIVLAMLTLHFVSGGMNGSLSAEVVLAVCPWIGHVMERQIALMAPTKKTAHLVRKYGFCLFILPLTVYLDF